ncbi:MAG: alpha/beta-type small acid-soluble spore protein [Firmicutes bacterium]|nr:alpha/beta-type small acid-soluble spore protein [Bacillota bacterium]
MSPKKGKNNPTPAEDGREKLKWETARELGLDDDLAEGGDELTVREAGKIGGNMVKKLVKKGEQEIAEAEKGFKEGTE